MVKPTPSRDIVESWPKPNFINPETRSHAVFQGVTILFTVITLIVVALRAYVRFFALKSAGWDDYLIFVAALAAIAMCISVNLAMANYGWDRHYWDQKPEWFEVSELMQWIIQIIFIVVMSCAKLSALCTYLRAAQGTKYRRFVWATIIVVALWGISFLFATIFECKPVHLYWTGKDGDGCTNEDARLLVATIINIITDIQVVLMPIPIIIRLHIRKREKVTLAVLMCLGLIATVASIVRTVVMSQSLTELRYDMTWNAFIVWIWLIMECDLAIICISVPVLRVLVKRFKSHRRKGNTPKKNNPTKPSKPFPPPLMRGISDHHSPVENRAIGNEPARPSERMEMGKQSDSLGEGQHHVIGYDRYGQLVMRDDDNKNLQREKQIGDDDEIARVV